ncbi:MAG TPA: hypothetical protein VKO18_03765 [Terriglobia bacterium]|nr:hypothetical protein [Terriglobia bacterium]
MPGLSYEQNTQADAAPGLRVPPLLHEIKQGTVLGIDVGYSKRLRTTCLCLLKWSDEDVRLSLKKVGIDEQERARAIGSMFPEPTDCNAVAIDGPLTRDFRVVSDYRAADALLSRGVFQKRGKPGQTSAPVGQKLHEHATRLAKLVLDGATPDRFAVARSTHIEPISEFAIVEAFPNAFLASAIDDQCFPELNRDASRWRRRKSDQYWVHLAKSGGLTKILAALLPHHRLDTTNPYWEISIHGSMEHSFPARAKLEDIRGHDERAALVCALTALAVATESSIGVGDPEYGDIFLPPVTLWGASRSRAQPWFEIALRENIATTMKDTSIVNHQRARVRFHGSYWIPAPCQCFQKEVGLETTGEGP